MTDELETALRETLANAAERAPKAPAGVGLAPPRRTRTPRGYSRMVLVAAAVAVAIGGATVGGRALTSGARSSASGAGHRLAAPSPALHPPKKSHVPSIEKVWPKAVHRVPRTLSNGHGFHPEAFIDDHTILISTESSFEKADALYAYDLRTHATKRVTTVVTPPNTTLFASGLTTGSGYAAWYLAGRYGTEVWAAPLSGGTAHLVGRVNTPAPSRLAIDGGTVYWSAERTGGVYRAPLTGRGAVQEVPGTRSMYILDWPWIGSPPTTRGVGDRGTGMGVTAFANIRNVLTGERRSAHLTDRGAWNCDLTWCVGNGPNFVTEAQRRDGTGRRAIPPHDSITSIPPILDRFVVTFPAGGTIAIYDLRTGRIGDLRITSGKGGAGYMVPQDPANRLYCTTTNGGYVIVDLGAI